MTNSEARKRAAERAQEAAGAHDRLYAGQDATETPEGAQYGNLTGPEQMALRALAEDAALTEEGQDDYFRGVAESYRDDPDWGDVMHHSNDKPTLLDLLDDVRTDIAVASHRYASDRTDLEQEVMALEDRAEAAEAERDALRGQIAAVESERDEAQMERADIGIEYEGLERGYNAQVQNAQKHFLRAEAAEAEVASLRDQIAAIEALGLRIKGMVDQVRAALADREALEAACLEGLVHTEHGYRYRPAVAADAVESILAARLAQAEADRNEYREMWERACARAGAASDRTQWDAHWERCFRKVIAERNRESERAEKAEAERDAAVGQCRYLHQDGKTREQWHLDNCGAMAEVARLREQLAAVEALADEYQHVKPARPRWESVVHNIRRRLTAPGETLRADRERVWAEGKNAAVNAHPSWWNTLTNPYAKESDR